MGLLRGRFLDFPKSEEDNVPYTEDSTIADALTTFAQLVEKRDYDEAWSQWQSAKGQVDGFTYWYNLGTLQTLRGNYAEARFALEKARYLTLYSEATEKQLNSVVSQLGTETSTSLSDVGPILMNGIVAIGPMKLWFIIIVMAFSILVSLKTSMNKLIKSSIVASVALLIGVCAWLNLSTAAFISLKPIEVYAGPSKIFGGGKSIAPGTRVVGWKNGEWIKLYDSNGDVSWVPWNEVVLKAGWLWGND